MLKFCFTPVQCSGKPVVIRVTHSVIRGTYCSFCKRFPLLISQKPPFNECVRQLYSIYNFADIPDLKYISLNSVIFRSVPRIISLHLHTDLCDKEAARRWSMSGTVASHPSAWEPRPAGPTQRAKEASLHGARPGHVLRRSDPFSEAWRSSLLSSAPHCLGTPLPVLGMEVGEGEEGLRVEEKEEVEKGSEGAILWGVGGGGGE